MKLKTTLGILTSLLIASVTYGANNDFVVQNYAGIKAGMASPSEEGFDDGISYSLVIGKNFAKHQSFEFEINVNMFEDDENLGIDLTQSNYMINYRTDFNLTNWLFFDLGAGGGLSQVRMKENGIAEKSYVTTAQYFGSIGFQVTDNIDISFEYKRLWIHNVNNLGIESGFNDLFLLSSTYSF